MSISTDSAELKQADGLCPALAAPSAFDLGFRSIELRGCQLAAKAFQIGACFFLLVSDLFGQLELLARPRQTILQGSGVSQFGKRTRESCEIAHRSARKMITFLDGARQSSTRSRSRLIWVSQPVITSGTSGTIPDGFPDRVPFA